MTSANSNNSKCGHEHDNDTTRLSTLQNTTNAHAIIKVQQSNTESTILKTDTMLTHKQHL